jgi:AcrR family transcriptional regulator
VRQAPATARSAPKSVRVPSINSHASRQRERILDAAEMCFIQSGFHGASMAHIATTAGMSPGLIYRYFDSKSAIVKAIIERHIESDQCQQIGKLNSPADVTRGILEVFESWRRGDDPKFNPVLLLELSAEATRDAQIAHAVRSKDRVIGEEIAEAVRRCARLAGITLTPALARSRAVMLQCLVEGLAIRLVRDPTLRRRTVEPALEKIIAELLS